MAIILEQCANFLLQVHYRGLQTFWKAQLGTPLPFCAQNVTLVEIMCEFYGLKWIWVRRLQAGIVKADGVIKLCFSLFLLVGHCASMQMESQAWRQPPRTFTFALAPKIPKQTEKNSEVGKIKISKYQRREEKISKYNAGRKNIRFCFHCTMFQLSSSMLRKEKSSLM